jgi:hypothetical protein
MEPIMVKIEEGNPRIVVIIIWNYQGGKRFVKRKLRKRGRQILGPEGGKWHGD